MGFFRGFAGVAAAAACVLVQAGPVGAQSIQTEAERVRALEQKIRTYGSRLDGTAGDYICSSKEKTAVITVISYEKGGVTFEKQVGLYQGLPNWQKVADKGILTGNHTLYLTTDAILQDGIVSINPIYVVIPQGQEDPIPSLDISTTPVALDYIDQFTRMTREARLSGMEEAVSKACKPKSEEPSYPVIVQLLAPPTFQM